MNIEDVLHAYYFNIYFWDKNTHLRNALRALEHTTDSPQRRLIEASLYDFGYKDPIHGLNILIDRSRNKVHSGSSKEAITEWMYFLYELIEIDLYYRKTGRFIKEV